MAAWLTGMVQEIAVRLAVTVWRGGGIAGGGTAGFYSFLFIHYSFATYGMTRLFTVHFLLSAQWWQLAFTVRRTAVGGVADSSSTAGGGMAGSYCMVGGGMAGGGVAGSYGTAGGSMSGSGVADSYGTAGSSMAGGGTVVGDCTRPGPMTHPLRWISNLSSALAPLILWLS